MAISAALNPVGKLRSLVFFARQLAHHRPSCGDDDLRAVVYALPGIVERVDRSSRVKMQIATPIDAPQQVLEERRNVVNIQRLVVGAIDDQ